MAGSEPRTGGGSPQPHHSDWGRLEAAILSGWRNFWQSVGKERAALRASPEEADEEASSLTRLPVSVGRHPRRTAGRAGRGARRGGLWRPGRGEASLGPACVWPRPCSHSGQCRHLGAEVEQKRRGGDPWCPAAGPKVAPKLTCRLCPVNQPGHPLVFYPQNRPRDWVTLNVRLRKCGDHSRRSGNHGKRPVSCVLSIFHPRLHVPKHLAVLQNTHSPRILRLLSYLYFK